MGPSDTCVTLHRVQGGGVSQTRQLGAVGSGTGAPPLEPPPGAAGGVKSLEDCLDGL